MHYLYIDANIYLNFFDSKQQKFKQLLETLQEVKKSIFITTQIVDEVNRNKLRLFKKSLDSYTNQSDISKTSLPEHLDNEVEPKISAWNKKRKELEGALSIHNKDIRKIYEEILPAISTSEDNVSVILSTIFEQALEPDKETFDKAVLRKSLGNPPGKNQDPLGDQLSWEMLLKVISGISRLWIVTKDEDYYTPFSDKCYLNPKLYSDLININPTLDIKLFNSLSDALDDFNSIQPISNLPSPEQLSVIANEESNANKTVIYGGSITFGQDLTICPQCGSQFELDMKVLRLTDGSALRSYTCNRCNHTFLD